MQVEILPRLFRPQVSLTSIVTSAIEPTLLVSLTCFNTENRKDNLQMFVYVF